jgi:hypothetical protein
MNDNIEQEINSFLLENRNILQSNYALGKTKIHLSELVTQGFLISYHTNQMKHQDTNQLFVFYYDYGIGKSEDNYCEIIRLAI